MMANTIPASTCATRLSAYRKRKYLPCRGRGFAAVTRITGKSGPTEVAAVERERDEVLFPAIEPYNAGHMPVSDGHSLYYEECGNARGLPVVVLHGGPGTGATPIHRRFFDPSHYRVIVFDQRGAGRSRPVGRLDGHTTGHLIGDMESLRTLLGMEKWLIFGPSWGSMLGMAYGIAHPDRCLGFALHGIALPRGEMLDWWVYGRRHFIPAMWRAFAEFIPEAERKDLLTAYYNRLMHDDPSVHMPAARSWIEYDAGAPSVTPMQQGKLTGKSDEQILGMARIEAHYFKNMCFLDTGRFLENLSRITHLPAFITHGRCDLVCTPDNAHDLARLWKGAKLSLVEAAGHTYREPNNAAAIIRVTEEIRTQGLQVAAATPP